MMLILGGTTEGRIAVGVADEAGKPYFYSTKGMSQEVVCRYGTRLAGGMDDVAMANFCRTHAVRLLVDAAHPFAAALHRTVCRVAEQLHLPVIRFERIYPPLTEGQTGCRDYAEAVRRLEADGVEQLLILTGVQTLVPLKPYWQHHTAWARVLNREESIRQARECGFPVERLLFYRQGEENLNLPSACHPQAILTKESGLSGGFAVKAEAARAAGIPLYVVERPQLSSYTITVTGPHGLRRAIESLLPDFYPLRSGFTTGTCATVAAKAALLALLGREENTACSVRLPDGETITLPVEYVVRRTGQATAAVIKTAGDDPDVTDGCRVCATVSFNATGKIRFLQGEGIGQVTLPGLGLPVGEPAINPVPRQMIQNELSALCRDGVDVEISIPGGQELAARTFNPKLGIVGGLSILGSSGIVRPFSSEAFVESVRREVAVCRAAGSSCLVINSGAKSERFVRREFPSLPPYAFVHYGNFIGETLRAAAEQHIKEVIMGIMIGKAVKLAEGTLDTHSKHTLMNRAFLQKLAEESECSSETVEAVGGISLARNLWHLLRSDERNRFFPLLLRKCLAHTSPLLPEGHLSILLIDEEGNIPFRV